MRSLLSEKFLRRTCCILAAFTIAAGLIMMVNTTFSERKLPKGMQSPGIAMELARTNQDIYNIVGEPVDDSDSARRDRKTMLRLQNLDRWIFIPSYLLFFSAVALYMLVVLRRTRWFGILVFLLTVAAAILDYCEDYWIVRSIRDLDHPYPINISTCGYWKWGLLFLMLICLLPLFWRCWPNSASLRLLGAFFGVYAAFSGGAGVLACFLFHGGRVESASNAFAAPVIFFLPFVAVFYHGTLNGLNAIADWLVSFKILGIKPFCWIVNWPEYGQKKI